MQYLHRSTLQFFITVFSDIDKTEYDMKELETIDKEIVENYIEETK